MRLLVATLALCRAALPVGAQPICGDPAVECPTPAGFYRLALPTGAKGPVPAVIFLHGWGGSSKGVMKNTAMLATLSARGYALIVPEGVKNSPEYKQRDWSVRDGSDYERDDLAFLAEVLNDAAAHGIDQNRVLRSDDRLLAWRLDGMGRCLPFTKSRACLCSDRRRILGTPARSLRWSG